MDPEVRRNAGISGRREITGDEKLPALIAALRQRFLVPVYVLFTADVPQSAQRAAMQGVKDALQAAGRGGERPLVPFRAAWADAREPHSSPGWYVAETGRIERQHLGGKSRDKGCGPQLHAGVAGRLLMLDPYQWDQPHWDVLVINQDLWDGPGTNWVFGVTHTGYPYSIQSVTRILQNVRGDADAFSAVRRILRHEVGHMLGLPDGRRGRDLEDSLGSHCSNAGCSMRQGLSVARWVELAREEDAAAARSGSYFCSCCCADLESLWHNAAPPIPPEGWDTARIFSDGCVTKGH